MIPIRHKDCGGVTMWYIGEREEIRMRSRDIIYLDGSRPYHAGKMPDCAVCGLKLHAGSFSPLFGFVKTNIKRCFDEDLEPSPVVRAVFEALKNPQTEGHS